VRRAGLTFAPEAGTQRLRDVINKNEDEERILETVDVAFSSGWNRIKLYFMIGLPTETDDDLEGIAHLVSKVRETARRRRSGARLNVSISPFVPKPHSPFQWERQDAPEETRRKESFLKERLRMRGLKLSLRDPDVSFLEGVMARGGRELSLVIEAAWKAGARFDGWTETFDFGIWRGAFEASGIEPVGYLSEIPTDAALPWDHIEGGASKAFLLEEREKAFRGETTPDCRLEGCFDCGACTDGGTARAMPPRVESRGRAEAPDGFGRRERRVRRARNDVALRCRVRYAKRQPLRFLSHLDVVRSLVRALAISGLPVAFSQGFNPHPKLSLGPPLPVGATGDSEFVDIEFTRAVGAEEIRSRLSPGLPDGIEILSVSPSASRASAAAQAVASEYLVGNIPGLQGIDEAGLTARMEAVRRLREATVSKGGREKTVKPADQILEFELVELEPLQLRVVLALNQEGAVRPVDVVRFLLEAGEGPPTGPPELATVHRRALYKKRMTGRPGLEPMAAGDYTSD